MLHFVSRDHTGRHEVDLDSVLALRAEDKYTIAVTPVREYLLEASLKQIMHVYPGYFVRVHRGVLVNPLCGMCLRLPDRRHETQVRLALTLGEFETVVLVSRRFLQSVRKMIKLKRLDGSPKARVAQAITNDG